MHDCKQCKAYRHAAPGGLDKHTHGLGETRNGSTLPPTGHQPMHLCEATHRASQLRSVLTPNQVRLGCVVPYCGLSVTAQRVPQQMPSRVLPPTGFHNKGNKPESAQLWNLMWRGPETQRTAKKTSVQRRAERHKSFTMPSLSMFRMSMYEGTVHRCIGTTIGNDTYFLLLSFLFLV